MPKTAVDVLTNDKISAKIITKLNNNSGKSKKDLQQLVLDELILENPALEEKAIKDFKSNFGNVLKLLEEKKKIKAQGTTANKIYYLEQPEEPKKSPILESYDEIGVKARTAIIKYLKKDNSPVRKVLIEEIALMIGITKEDTLIRTSDSKYSRYKSIIGIQLTELTNEKVVNLIKINGVDCITLVTTKKEKSLKTTRKKESISPINKKNFLESSNKKILSNLEDYMKIKEKYEEKQREEILNALCDCDSSVFEKLCVDLICCFYDVDFKFGSINGGVDDHGIDGFVEVRDPMGFPPKKLAVQSKCFKDPKKGCTPTIINAFYGAMARKNIRKGFIITTGIFNKEAINKQFANEEGTCVIINAFNEDKQYNFGKNERMIICIDGKNLVRYLVHYQLGINIKDNNIISMDENYFLKKTKDA